MPAGEREEETTLLAVAKEFAGGLVARELLDHQWRDVVVVEGASSGLQVEEEVFQELDGDVLRGAFAVALAVALAAGLALFARRVGGMESTACSRGSRSSGRTAARSLQTR